MRQLRLLALLAPALLLPVACENSSSGTGGTVTFEAGPGFEAGPLPEAGPLDDAGSDAPDVVVPPAPKGVSVSVFLDATPKADVRVISQDATGAVIGDQKTDATGRVVITTPPSMVTVLSTKLGIPAAVTFFAVADGDNLVVRIPPSIPTEQPPISQYSVTFGAAPVAAPILNADVSVNGSCGNSGNPATPVVVSLYPGCVSASNAILADGSTNGARVGFAFKKSVTAPAANATDNVLLGAWTAPGQTTLNASNRPPSTSSLSSNFYMIANGASFQTFGTGSFDDGGMIYPTATGFADAYQSLVRAHANVANALVATSFIRREAVAPAPPVFDFSAALPYITDAKIDVTTPARPVVTLTSGSLAAADGGIVAISWLVGQSTSTWTFVLPSSAAATFKAPALPALPADAPPFVPVANASVDSVVFFDATQIPGYTEAKTLPVTPTAPLTLLDGSVPLPTNGTVRVTSWAPAPQVQ